MNRLLIVVLLLASALLAIPVVKLCKTRFQLAMESFFIQSIEAENAQKTKQWLEEKKRYESGTVDGSGNRVD